MPTKLLLAFFLSQTGMGGSYCDGWYAGWPDGWCNSSTKKCPEAPPPPRCMAPGVKTAYEQGYVDSFGIAMRTRKRAKK
jgi:hypothetical protein